MYITPTYEFSKRTLKIDYFLSLVYINLSCLGLLSTNDRHNGLLFIKVLYNTLKLVYVHYDYIKIYVYVWSNFI